MARDTGFPTSDAQNDFTRARRSQALSRLRRRLAGQPGDVDVILPFDEVVEALGRVGEKHLGLQTIDLDTILGTVDRTSGFDRQFRPTSSRVRTRWERIANAMRRGEAMPPISGWRCRPTRRSGRVATPGLASARTPLFQAFPRVGIPRAFDDYADYVEAVDLLIRCDAFPDPTFLWWDVRPQPRFGTVETRIMDVQSTLTGTRALVALVQCLVRLEVEEGYAAPALVNAPEALGENRFIAARDGTHACLLDPARSARAVREIVDDVLAACAPHASALGCRADLELVPVLFEDPSADRQRRIAEEAGGLPGLVRELSADMMRGLASGSDEGDRAPLDEAV